MLTFRIARGVLAPFATAIAIWAILGSFLVLIVLRTFPPAAPTLIGALLGPGVSVLVHEYGHARMARHRGAEDLVFVVINGVPAVQHVDLGRASNLLIALGGPLTSAVIGTALVLAGAEIHGPLLTMVGVITAVGVLSLAPWAHDGRQIWRLLDTRN